MNYTMIKRFYILLLAIVASVGTGWALTPQGTDTWDETTKTLTVNSNPGNAAYQDQSEIKHVVISSSVTQIGGYAFGACFYLETVIASEGLETIAEGAFSGCEHLESVTLPSTLQIVDQHAFAGDSNLKSVTITAPALNDDYGYGVYAFEDTHADLKIYVPEESVETYKTKWSDYEAKIVAIGSGSTPAGNSITINESSHGSVVASPTSAEAGETITLTATPDDGYQLKSISGVYVPVSEILNATSETVNGNKFQAQATSRNNNGWRVYNPGTANTLTVSSLNGTTLITKIEFTSTWGGQRKNNMLSVSAGTLSFDPTIDPDTIVTINGINATSVTISGSGTNAGQTWCIKSVKVYYEGTDEEELEISDTENANVKTFTMVESDVTISAEFEPASTPTPAYETVMNLINEIPNPAVLTAECKEKVDAARAAYDALSDGDKAQVTNIATLTTAEAAFENVMNIWLSGDCDVILWSDSTMTVKKHAGDGNGAMKDYTDYYGDDMTPWFSDHWYDPQPGQIVIKSITIEEGVTRIGENAFGWMDGLKTVTIPASMASIGNDAFYWSKEVEDIYLTVADPSNLTWVLPYKAEYQFKPEKATRCHVPADKLAAYQFYFSEINVTFVADLPPIAPVLTVGLTLNANDEFYLGPDTTCFQFNCFSSNRYFFGKGSFRINFENPDENVYTMIFEPKKLGTDVMMMYRNGETFETYGTNCCATALPTSATVTAGDGTKANPFVLEPNTKGECVQAAFSTLPQAADGLLFDMTEKTLITAGVVNAGNVQYSLDNGANWSAELPKATDPGTYKVHYRVLGGNSCVLGIDYDENNFVEATIASDPNVVVWDSTFVKQVSTYRSNAGYNFNKHNVKDGITAFFEGTQVFNGFFGDELYFSGPSALLTFTHEAGKIAKAEFYGTITAASDTEYNGWVWDADNNKLVWEGTPNATISIQGQGSGKLDVKDVTYMIFTLVPPTPEEVMALINAIGTVEYTAECKQKIDLARKTYERLVGEVAKAAVTNYSTLTQAETDFAALQSAAVQNAIDKIAAIPTPVVYTEACGNAIDAARAAYNALLEADMSQIPEASVTKLTEAENTYANLAAADPVITKIDNIPFPVEATLATRDSIQNARAAYDALTAAQKAVVSNYQKLLDAEAALAGLMPPPSLPEGALSGKFTINKNGDQIMFAKGNLQATTTDLGATWTWGFATNQWDTIGCAGANTKITGNGTVSENGTVDLFGWSTEATYYGINKSTSSDTYTGGVLKDWGENITSAAWRTLTQDEWKYVLQIRINDKNLRGQATVNGMKGYILLPDKWELPTGSSFTPMPNNWTANVYEGDEWTAMENAGAVFLPIAPRRSGIKVQMQTTGSYWTATKFGSSDSGSSSWMFQILEDFAKTDMSSRYYGYPVRLTMPAVNTNPFDSAQAVKELIDAIPVPVTLNDSSAIYAAREAFDALSDWAKNAIDAATVQKLTDAETALNTLLVQEVIDMINALPNPMTEATTKLSVYTQASEVRAAYDALTPAQKAVVSNIDILEAVEAVFDAIASSGGSGETVIKWDKTTGIAYVSPATTSPAYEHMTVTTGNGSSFSVFMQARLSFGFNSQPNGGFTFANVDGYNLTKVEIKSTNALTSTMQEVDRMGSGWAISDDYKTATWTGNADSVSIWKGQSFTNYWYTDTILFTIATPGNPIMDAFAAVDKINLIPDPVTLEDACVNAIKDARAAVDSLYAHKSLIDDPDMLKLTDAEQALKDLNQAVADKVIAKINNIPLPVELKLATRDSINNARAAYDALTEDQQKLVTNYQTLLDAEAALAALNPGGGGAAEGALSGKFTINADGDQIAFAKGNLQATTTDLGETWTWGFAAHQWEVIGNAAANNAVSGNKTVSTNGTVDLFGWSTPMTYYGIHNSTNSDYYSDDFREWGENITGATWKTLSPSDWIYIISDRANAADKQGQATVNGVNGYIFLPDEWELPSGLSFTAKPNSWTANVYDGDDWTAMENAGAVFLPKSSWRKGNTVTALAYGYYWSSDYNNYSNAMAYYFSENLTITGTGIPRYAGIYVRLVTAEAGSLTPLDSAQHVKDLIDAIPVPVTLSSKDAIDAARNAYDALADATKNALDPATVQKLTDAEDAYAALIQAATDVIALINAIPQPVVYNEACGDSIAAAREAYDALSDELKAIVSNYQTLLDAEDAYADAKQAHDAVAYAAIDKINAIPVPVEYSSKAAIDTARVAYDALLDTQKALVSEEVLQKLTDAEAAWAAIAAKVEHNVTYIGKDGTLKQEIVALLNLPDPAPEFNGYEFDHWDVKAGDFLEEGLRIKAVYTPIITTNPQGFDTLAYNGLAQELVKAGEAKEGHIEYSLQPEEPESWSAELPKATFAGVYAIYYKLVREGHADYLAPEPTMATIAKVPVTYVAPIAYDTLVYNAVNQTLAQAGTTTDGTFWYSLNPTDDNSWKTAVPQGFGAGAYNVYYKVVGDINHLDSIAPAPVAVTIAKAALTATADDKDVIYGDAVPAYTVTYAGWQGDDDAAVLTGDIAFACEYAQTSNVGEYTITPSGIDAANYSITFVNGKVTVAKAELMITAEDKNLTYGDAVPTYTAAYEGFKNNDDATVISGLIYTCEYAPTSNVGEYTIVPSGATATNYNISYTNGKVTVAKAALMITADDKNVIYGDAVPAYTASYEGFKNNDDATVISGLIYTCEYAPTSNVGEYTIVPSGATATNYNISFTNGKVTVAKADLMITADDKNVIYGDAVPEYTATYSGWKNEDDASVVSGLIYTCEYAPTSNVGEYTIVPSGATATNYEISFTNGKVTVSKATLTITAENKEMIYGDEHPEFTVTYSGWINGDDESVVSGLQFSTPYAPGSYIGTYAINPNSATALNYAITFVDGTLTVNKAHVYVSGAEVHTAKFADGHAIADVTKQGTLNGIKLNDAIAHVTTAAFSSADVAEHLTITLFYELTGDAALLNNYNLDPTSEIYTTEGVIIEPFIPNDEHKPAEGEQVEVQEGIDVYAYGYCDGSGYSLKYHLNSGNPDQYKIDFADSRFTDIDWTNLVTTGKDGTIDILIPVDLPTGDYTMTVYFRDSRFDWLESQQFNVTFHVNLPETYVRPLFDNVIALVDTCHCLTDIQWYWRANSSDPWQPIEGANGYYYHADGKLTGEYFVKANMNGVPTYTCGQTDMETLYGADKNEQAAIVKAYPNPVITTTKVTIENSDSFNHNLRVVNLMGVEVMNTSFEGNETQVDMYAYPQGNYMITVDGIVVKVMKQ